MSDPKKGVAGSYRLRVAGREQDEVSSDLKAYLSRFGKRIPVTLGIGGRNVVLKHILLPRLEGPDLVGAAATELAASVQFPIENSLVDCSVLERVEQDGIAKMRVIGVIAEKKSVIETVELVQRSNGEVYAIEPGAFAIARYSSRMDSPTSGKFWIQIRPDSLAVCAVVDGKIIFWREVLRDFSVIGESGMRAEMAREGTISEAVQSFDYFATKHHQVEITNVIFVSSLPGSAQLRPLLSQGLGMDVSFEDPFERLQASPNERPEGDTADNDAYVVAAGLSLREVA